MQGTRQGHQCLVHELACVLVVSTQVVPDYRGWFCEYMAKRAAQEHNYQQLYLRMLDKMNDPLLMKQLIKSTYFYVRLLLTGDRAVRESNDRQLLKNLGHWLGNLTLKKNKPLLCKELELKGVSEHTYFLCLMAAPARRSVTHLTDAAYLCS